MEDKDMDEYKDMDEMEKGESGMEVRDEDSEWEDPIGVRAYAEMFSLYCGREIFPLSAEIAFPDPMCWADVDLAPDDNGMLAVGGDLSQERLLLAYSNGIFPWYGWKADEYIHWYCPMDRFVLFPEKVHISHSMRNMMNKGRYLVTIDQAFDEVLRGCSEVTAGKPEERRSDHEMAWLGPDIMKAYKSLHEAGYATSVEVWRDGNLVGGLYGVTLCNCFFGESMFSRESGASKLALIKLAQAMEEGGMKMIDMQFETPHLLSMGGEHISYREYMRILGRTEA